MSAFRLKAAFVAVSRHVAEVPILFSNGSRGGCSDPEWLCYAYGDAVLCVLDGTRWGQPGVGWLGCKPQSADRIDRMLQNRRHHPFPPSASLRSGARFGLLSARRQPELLGARCRPGAWRA